MTKMTKKNVFEALVNFANGGDMVYETADGAVEVTKDVLGAFATKEIELLNKKAEKAKANAKAKKADTDELAEAVAAVLNGDEFQTIEQVTVQIDGEDVTTAKVQYRLNALVNQGIAEKTQVTIVGENGKKRKEMGYKILAANAED